MYIPQLLTTSLFLLLTPVFAMPKAILHRSASPSLYPRDFAPGLAARQSCVDTCGSVCYWQSDIDAAVQKGYSLYQSGDTVGDNDYPHEFDDREGFDITVSGPWYEFPILSSYEVYDGGAPGADRVVFNDEGTLALVVTHTGASGDNFVECSGEQP